LRFIAGSIEITAIAKLQKGTAAVKLHFWGRKPSTKLKKG